MVMRLSIITTAKVDGTTMNGTSLSTTVRRTASSTNATPITGSWKGSLTEYVELHTASAFSFLRGASLPETLVERAAALGYPALALLDADGVYGAPRFHKAAKQAGIKAIIGAELTIGTRDSGFGIREPR